MNAQAKPRITIVLESPHHKLRNNYVFVLRIDSNLSSPLIRSTFDVYYRELGKIEKAEIDKTQIFLFRKMQYLQNSTTQFIGMLKRLGKIIIFDTDDFVIELPSYSMSQYMIVRGSIKNYLRNIRMSDQIVVSTEYLQSLLRPCNAHTSVIENTIEMDTAGSPAPFTRQNKTVTILVSSNDNIKVNRFRDDFIRLLQDIKRHYRSRVHIIIQGRITNLGKAEDFVDERHGYLLPEEYFAFLSSKNIHIGLVPLGGTEDPEDLKSHRAKSLIKFLEFTKYGVCGIYSKVGPYVVIRDRHEGMLVENTYDQWYNAICELVEKPSLREKIISGAVRTVRARYTKEVSRRKYYALLSSLAEQGDRSKPISQIQGLRLLAIKYIYRFEAFKQKARFASLLWKQGSYAEIARRLINLACFIRKR